MSRDWNIVEDEEPFETQKVEDDPRLNLERVRTIARERRTADRLVLWRFGAVATLSLAALILIVRSAGWLLAGEHRGWALSALAASVAMITAAWRLLSVARRLS